MTEIKRTDASNPHFRELVRALDQELAIQNGTSHGFYSQFNKIDTLQHVVVAYQDDIPVGCGALKPFSDDAMEVKRMFVPAVIRRSGIASFVLAALEAWAKEMGYEKCVLETGQKQPNAIALYKKNGYRVTPNYGQYIGIENSVCFEKLLQA